MNGPPASKGSFFLPVQPEPRVCLLFLPLSRRPFNTKCVHFVKELSGKFLFSSEMCGSKYFRENGEIFTSSVRLSNVVYSVVTAYKTQGSCRWQCCILTEASFWNRGLVHKVKKKPLTLNWESLHCWCYWFVLVLYFTIEEFPKQFLTLLKLKLKNSHNWHGKLCFIYNSPNCRHI